VAGLAAVGIGLDRRLDSVQRVEIGQSRPDPLDTGAPTTLLVLGTDGQRSDVILVVRVARGRVSTLSIPRDLWTGTGTERMNALSPAAQAAWLDRHLGIHVDHLVSMDMEGFARLADRIGPRVRVDLPIRDRQSGLALDAGCQRLDGEQALAYVRARHLRDLPGDPNSWRTDPAGDIGRIARTQSLVRATWAQLDRLDAGDLPGLVDLLVEHATVDSGLDTSDLLSLARTIRSAGAPPATVTLPVVAAAVPVGPASYASAVSLRPGATAERAVASVGGRLSPTAPALPVSNLPGEQREAAEYPASATLGLVSAC
jgi:LCP family protein required for cell wall assembly